MRRPSDEATCGGPVGWGLERAVAYDLAAAKGRMLLRARCGTDRGRIAMDVGERATSRTIDPGQPPAVGRETTQVDREDVAGAKNRGIEPGGVRRTWSAARGVAGRKGGER